MHNKRTRGSKRGVRRVARHRWASHAAEKTTAGRTPGTSNTIAAPKRLARMNCCVLRTCSADFNSGLP